MNYFELQPEQNTFSNIVVDLTHKCNMQCSNCYIPNRDIPDLDKEKLYAFLKRLPNRVYVRLIGAEPTMRDDLFEIIATIKDIGHRPSLVTNGLKLAQDSYVAKLKSVGLRWLTVSMNGADEDDVYKVLDNGNWATVKVRALENVFRHRLPINTGTLIAKGVNEHSIKRQIDLFVKKALEFNINFDIEKPYSKITPILRFKSVGVLGRNMGDAFFYKPTDWAKLVSEQLNLPYAEIVKSKATSGVVKAGDYGNAYTSLLYPYQTDAGKIYLRFIDWGVDEEGVIDGGNPHRGRLTQNWTIAPFFEHVKLNEFGY